MVPARFVTNTIRKLTTIGLSLLLFGLISFPIRAYQSPSVGEEIQLNDVRIGLISPEMPQQTYLFTSQAGLSVEFDLLVADGELNPAVVISLDNIPLGVLTGLDSEHHLKQNYTFEQAGVYTIGISGLDDRGGLYAFAIRVASPQQPNAVLPLNNTTVYSLARGEAMELDIQADPSLALIVTVNVENTTRSASVTLKSSDGNVIGTIGAAIFGGGFLIPAGGERYRLEIINGETGSTPLDFEVSVVGQT